jgi:hypothetical protein
MIMSELVSGCEPFREQPEHNLTEPRGLGKEIWEGIDAQGYVDRLRGPWPDEVT